MLVPSLRKRLQRFQSQACLSRATRPCCDDTSDHDEHNTDNTQLLLFADAFVAPALLVCLSEVDELLIALDCRFALDIKTDLHLILSLYHFILTLSSGSELWLHAQPVVSTGLTQDSATQTSLPSSALSLDPSSLPVPRIAVTADASTQLSRHPSLHTLLHCAAAVKRTGRSR